VFSFTVRAKRSNEFFQKLNESPSDSSVMNDSNKRKAPDSPSSSNKKPKLDRDENTLDEKDNSSNTNSSNDEKKEREVKEDMNAEALAVNDPDLCVAPADKDLICAICYNLLNQPKGFQCGHSFCSACIVELKKQKKKQLICPLDNQKVTEEHPSRFLELKISGLCLCSLHYSCSMI
jgi:hypothetical protein